MTEADALVAAANRLLADVTSERVTFTTQEIGNEQNFNHRVDEYAVADILCSFLSRYGHQVDWDGTPPTIEVR